MSLKFNWPNHEQQLQFIELLKNSLTEVLNAGEKPKSVVGPITITGVELGSQPPIIEILNITDASLAHESFGASIRMVYEGDASLQLETVVQVNRICGTSQHSLRTIKRVGILCAHKELNVPIKLTISHIKLAGVLVVVKAKGSLDIRFKNDPLKNVQITSTFDSLAPARKVVQRMVEGRLREFMMVRLPAMSKKINDTLNPPSAGPELSCPVDNGCGKYGQEPDKMKRQY